MDMALHEWDEVRNRFVDEIEQHRPKLETILSLGDLHEPGRRAALLSELLALETAMGLGSSDDPTILDPYPRRGDGPFHPVNVEERAFLSGVLRMRGCGAKAPSGGFASSLHRRPCVLDLADGSWEGATLPDDDIQLPANIVADEDASWDQKLLPVEKEGWPDMGTHNFS